MKKRKCTPRALIICAILVVTLIGSAIAATEYRVFDFLYWMNPLEGAEKLVQTNSGKTENEYTFNFRRRAEKKSNKHLLVLVVLLVLVLFFCSRL